MFKVIIIFSIFINFLFSNDLVIVNGTKYCTDGGIFSSSYNNGVVENLGFSFLTAPDKHSNIYFRYLDYAETSNNLLEIYLDCGSVCDVNISKKVNYLNYILTFLHNNVRGIDVSLKYGAYAVDKTTTVRNIIPSLPLEPFYLDASPSDISFLYGLSGLICASFLLYRIS